ncbi:transposase [Streptomyces sp. TRM66268-LWL]|uniref:Transposase n=1 Tax=Streptomyces polyasparticus TaxID=2767826 RepID=A0ABR7SMJ4_9ACTN|nr:Mu transposase C-terminal domain-containing protein [Streptomyces polyasparticus]MBC9715721.1 transposase [Streptomyces polyasparticus]
MIATTLDDGILQDSPAPQAEPALDTASLTALRAPAVRRLLALRAARRLTRAHVHTTAQCLNVSDRTVWRWLADATTAPETAARPGARHSDRFEVTPEVRVLLAYWHGNASAVHRELVARAGTAAQANAADGEVTGAIPAAPSSRTPVPGGAPPAAVPLLDPVPSLSTFLRAVRRDLTAGERAGYRHGPEAARASDVFAKRPRTWRNHVWEADHVQAPLRVEADGELVPPYVTWFIDCATKAITGLAVTPNTPTRASILAALRSATLRTGPYGPFGGLPENVRFDRGRDFLSRTVSTALTALDADITILPPYSPHLKGSIENLNLNVSRMLFAALPGYTPKQPRRRPDRRPHTAPPMSFAAFTEELLTWAHWWNTEHRPAELHGATPLEAWQSDATPLNDIPAQDVWSFTLEDDGRTRTITSHGVRFKNRHYLADWMTGQAGREVTVRFMPHHTHEIEICTPHGRHLGTAYLADQATEEQRTELRRTRAQRARRLRAEAKAAEQLRHTRFAPATEPGQPRRLDATTATEAARELDQHQHTDLAALALPDLIPPAPPPADWAIPEALKARTRPTEPPDHSEDSP